MGLIRPELAQWLRPRRELIAAVLLILLGGYVALLGGWFLALIGALMIATGGGWALGSWRRLAFRRQIAAPGVLVVDEGAIRYESGHAMGGQIALRDLVELRLIRLGGHDVWRLKSRDGQALLVPTESHGAAQLADAFSALPGINMGRIAAALAQTDGPSLRIVWQAPG